MSTMIIRRTALVSCLLLASSLGWGAAPAESDNPDVPQVVAGNNQFAFDLYGTLAREEDGNLFFSPSSISTALAMTYAGARGNTEAQMADALHFTLPQDRLHPAFASLISDLNSPERQGYQLNVANRLWGQQGYDFLDPFLNTTRDHYGAELAEVDFVQQTEPTRQTINAWVEDQTQQKIKDLIPSGVLSPLTRLVLTNAIYFKGDWKYQFDPDLTEKAPFSMGEGKQLTVPMMHQASQMKYAGLPDFQMLEIPYSGEDLSMLALLPNGLEGLAGLESWLTAENLDQSIDQLRSREVSLFLPKFGMTCDFRLAPALASMGMPEAFQPGAADFSGMNGRRDLFISDVLHKAFVNVNEEGTEAAAATGVGVGVTSVPPPPVLFRADHPFLFLIRDNSTQSILFMGRVMEPAAAGAPSVPEPSSLLLLSAGAVGLLAYFCRRRKRR